MPEETPKNRATLNDGRWVELRPMYIREQLRIIELDAEVAERPYLEMVQEYAKLLEPAILRRSDGLDDLLAMSEDAFIRIFFQWKEMTEDDALPPAYGTDSATKPSAPGTPRRKVSRPKA